MGERYIDCGILAYKTGNILKMQAIISSMWDRKFFYLCKKFKLNMKKQIKKHADLFNNKNRTGMSEVLISL